MVKTKDASSSGKTSTKKPVTKKRGAKAKKAPIKRTISDALIPIKDETWLIQPIAVTMMRYDYSLIQVRILVSIVENLQAILLGILNNKQSAQLDLFQTKELDEDGRMPIKLPFKELGVDPNHYPELRTSLKMLASLPVEIPYKTSEGRKYTKYTNLCDVYIPQDRSYNKYAILKLNRAVAERLVSLDLGYHRLGKQIVFACKNKYTQRIYMFIESWVNKGRTVIKTIDFRKMLRLEDNYKKFSDFCRRVLEPAMAELKDMAAKGYCDCYFEYEKKYDHGQRGGEPDELIFTIFKANNNVSEQLEAMSEAQRSQFKSMLLKYFEFDAERAQQLALRINAESYQEVISKLIDLRERFRNTYIKDKAAYTYKSLDELLKQKESVASEAVVVE
ncbi:replication initiation protein [Prevotella amnii]|jgi:initiator repB protein|uniref:Replication protein RepB n=1 Tax=Prevotella amnii DNF00058 TaxID=1401066 RepID=A0A096AT32_9BACT|nr:replication initiation protein [Prevotella amnii]KGF49881.1 replication protein RepB [Prevotella amnii DNF00058]